MTVDIEKIETLVQGFADAAQKAFEYQALVSEAANEFKDLPEGEKGNFASPEVIGRLVRAARDMKSYAESAEKQANAMNDVVRKFIAPTYLIDQDMESTRISGVGMLSLRSDMYVSTPDAEGLQGWLLDNGYDNIIKPTVNASSLKSLIKGLQSTKGAELPDESIVKITPYDHVVLLK